LATTVTALYRYKWDTTTERVDNSLAVLKSENSNVAGLDVGHLSVKILENGKFCVDLFFFYALQSGKSENIQKITIFGKS
jgi:hypothetical protein